MQIMHILIKKITFKSGQILTVATWQDGQLKKFLFLVTAAILNGHNFERDPPRDHPCQVWFNLVQRFSEEKI
jgi:hypothetical protein